MTEQIINRDNKLNSLQISRMFDYKGGRYEPVDNFLIKNITTGDDGYPMPVKVRLKPAGQREWIDTWLQPGWNPEICQGLEALPQTSCCGGDPIECKLQIGW